MPGGNMTHVAYWWLFFWIQAIGYGIAWQFGIFSIVWYADISKLSFLIIFAHIITTMWVGIQTVYRGRGFQTQSEPLWFISDAVLNIGMIGTVVGFIYMISSTLGGMPDGDMSADMIRVMIKNLSVGIGTALWTTLWGLIASICIKTQLLNLEQTRV